MVSLFRVRCGVALERFTAADMAAGETHSRRACCSAFFAHVADERGRKVFVEMWTLMAWNLSHIYPCGEFLGRHTWERARFTQ